MDKVLDFLADNYVYFIIISAILLVALVGLIAKEKRRKKNDTAMIGSAANIGQPTDTPVAPEAPQMEAAPLQMENPPLDESGTLVIQDPSVPSEPTLNNETNTNDINQNDGLTPGENGESMLVIPDPSAPASEPAPTESLFAVPDPNAQPEAPAETPSEEPSLVIPDSSAPVPEPVPAAEPTPAPAMEPQPEMVPQQEVPTAPVEPMPGPVQPQMQPQMGQQMYAQQSGMYAQPQMQPQMGQQVMYQQPVMYSQPVAQPLMYTQPMPQVVYPNQVQNGQVMYNNQNNPPQM